MLRSREQTTRRPSWRAASEESVEDFAELFDDADAEAYDRGGPAPEHASAGPLGPEAVGATAWRIFDVVAQHGAMAGLEVVARPGEALTRSLRGDEIVIRRALGEGRLAFASTVGSCAASGYAEATDHDLGPAWSGRPTPRLAVSSPLPRDTLVVRFSESSDAESRGGSAMTLPRSHFEQWVINSVASDAARRPGPLGPRWVERKLRASHWSAVTTAAAELEALHGQRTAPSQLQTNYRVDTAQTEVLRRVSALLGPLLETIDDSQARSVSAGQIFASASDFAVRKDHWRAKIDALARSDRGALLDWIVGKSDLESNATIKSAVAECKSQLGKLLDAANAARATQSTKMVEATQASHVRNFDDQLCIWTWKYYFLTTRAGLTICDKQIATFAFGWMSKAAADKCTARALSASVVGGAVTGTVRGTSTTGRTGTTGASGRTSTTTAGTSAFTPRALWQPVFKKSKATPVDYTVQHRTAWTTYLTGDERQKEILQTSSAPGISRHHWGTDIDVTSTEAVDWKKAEYEKLYQWLGEHAMGFGAVQVYTPDRPGYTATSDIDGYAGYIEERWHWSYYPVAQALLEWASQPANKSDVLTRLQAAWGDVKTGSSYGGLRGAVSGWSADPDPFTYIQANWESYVFNVNRYVTPPVV